MTVRYCISAASSVATSYVITGPSSGTVGILSAPFAITPNGPYTGTITITCSDGEGPIVKTWSNSSATQTFALLPMSAGTVTLSIAPAPALTGLTSWNYDASGSPVAQYSISGSTTGSGAAGMSPATSPNYGYYPIYNNGFTVTLGPGNLDGIVRFFCYDQNLWATPYNGSIIPSSIVLTNTNRSGTFRYCPAPVAKPTIPINFFNTAGLTPSNPWTFASTAQTLLPYLFGTLGPGVVWYQTQPEAGLVGSQSDLFTWTLGDGTLTGTAVITPSDGAGGTWSPSTVSLTNAVRSGSSRLTPAVSGPLSISVTNDGKLYDPTPVPFYAGAPGTLAVTAVVTTSLTCGETASYSGQVSGGTPPYKYTWNFGDGSPPVHFLNVQHIPRTSGTLRTLLVVTDSVNAVATSTAIMTVANAIPAVRIMAPSRGTTYAPMYFGACVTDSHDDFVAGFTYAWTFGDGGTGTGQTPSHQYTTAGSYTVGVTVTDQWGGLGTATFALTIATPAITSINPAWIAAHGPSPYILNTAGAYYRFAQDVATLNGGFNIQAANITLDLNGYTLTYDNDTYISLPNNCFQSGDFTGWDVSGAPDASVVTSDPLLGWVQVMYGDYVCRLNCTSSKTNTILSPVITIPTMPNQAAMRYVAVFQTKTVSRVGSTNTTLSLIDAITKEVLATAGNYDLSTSKSLMLSTPSTLHLAAGQQVQLKVDYVPVSGATYNDQLSYFYFARDGLHTAGYINGILVNSGPGTNFVVRNGKILQGSSKSSQGQGINAQGTWATTDGVEIHCNGPDSGCISAIGNSYIIRNSTLVGEMVYISNRMAANALIYSLNSLGWIDVQYNSLSGQQQGGITLDPTGGAAPAVNCLGAIVNHNTFTMDVHSTNAYAIGLGTGIHNFEIAYNTSLPTAGSGLIIDCGYGRIEHGKIHDNIFHAFEPASLEYSQNMNSTAFRNRGWYWGSCRDLHVYNNEFQSHTEPGSVAQAWGSVIGEGPMMRQDWDANFVLRGNTFRAFSDALTQGSVTFNSAGIAFSGDNPHRGMILDGNVFEGNIASISLGNPQSYYAWIGDDYFTNNTCRKSSQGVATTHNSVNMLYTCDVYDVYMLDMSYDGGAVAGLNNTSTQGKRVLRGYRLDVTVKNADTSLAVGATVVLRSTTGTVWSSGITDNSGVVANLWAPVSLYTQNDNTSAATAVTTSLNPLSITASLAGHTATASISPTQHDSVILTLS